MAERGQNALSDAGETALAPNLLQTIENTPALGSGAFAGSAGEEPPAGISPA